MMCGITLVHKEIRKLNFKAQNRIPNPYGILVHQLHTGTHLSLRPKSSHPEVKGTVKMTRESVEAVGHPPIHRQTEA